MSKTTIYLGGIAGSYYRKSLETHHELLEKGEIYLIVDSDGVRRCCDCGFELENLIEKN